MARSKDLDTVAPDDLVISEEKTEEKIVEKKIEKTPPKKNSVSGKKEEEDVSNIGDKIYEILGHTKHPLSSILVKPDVFSFEERADKETIYMVARPHWFTNVSWVLTTLLLVVAPGLLKFVPVITEIPVKFQFLGILAWYLVSFAFAFEKFLSWYFDVFIITDERVIDIDFNNLLDKKFSEAKISMIQDITSRVSGVSQTMFNYGTVFIQTAAEVPEITLEKIANPEKIIKLLQVLREEEERETLEGRVK
ncbi:hypothetical protein KKD37_00560 [Patescibacteria group bacterium]|nr:hypothetical protein [Patescibacteria group bacterium]